MKDAQTKTNRTFGDEITSSEATTGAAAGTEKWLRCASCDGRIARESHRMSVSGKHQHEFMNPSGMRFTLSCFSAAPGCMGDGDRSTVWTWFPGYAWEIEVCRSCHAHLGWSFHGAADNADPAASFYGLIHDRLV